VSNVFEIKNRAAEFFRLHNDVPPAPQHGEEPAYYQRRVLSCAQSLLPPDNVWAGVNIGRQPERALDAIERAVIDGEVARIKEPRGLLREIITHDRAGRTISNFYGDPRYCWDVFAGPRRLATFTPGLGRGSDSPAAKATAAARAAAIKAAGL
jgi:hypothetical protein